MKKQKRIVISDESLNSYGFHVRTDGIELDAFMKNPVMLWNHNRDGHGTVNAQLPIGYWKDLRVEDGKLTGEPVFDESDPFAARIMKKFENGVLNACSIGFVPLEWSDAPADLKPGQTMPTVTRCRLLEVSICDIPANPNATVVLYDEDSSIVRLSELPVLSTNHKNTMNEQTQTPKPGPAGTAAPETTAANTQLSAEEVAALKAENERLKAAAQAREAANAETLRQEATQLLDEAVRTGRIEAASRPQFAKLFEADHKAAKAALSALPERKPLQVTNTGVQDEHAGWNYLDWMKNDPEGLRKMKADEPERFRQLQQTLNKKH